MLQVEVQKLKKKSDKANTLNRALKVNSHGRVDSTDEITSANFAQIQQLSSQNWIGYVCFSITVQTNRFAMGKLADRYSKEQEQLVHQIIAYRRSGLNFKQIADKLNELNITTINGNSFQNKHVHMMLKRYHQRQLRLNLMKTEYEEEWSKMEIKYEKTFSLPHSRN